MNIICRILGHDAKCGLVSYRNYEKSAELERWECRRCGEWHFVRWPYCTTRSDGPYPQPRRMRWAS